MTRDRFNILAAIAAAIFMTGVAPSSASSEPQGRVLAVDQVAGFWRLQTNGATCDLSLANLVIDGVRSVLVERCAMPEVQSAKSWRATPDGFQLLSSAGAVVMTFRRTGEDAFQADDGRSRLTRAPVS